MRQNKNVNGLHCVVWTWLKYAIHQTPLCRNLWVCLWDVGVRLSHFQTFCFLHAGGEKSLVNGLFLHATILVSNQFASCEWHHTLQSWDWRKLGGWGSKRKTNQGYNWQCNCEWTALCGVDTAYIKVMQFPRPLSAENLWVCLWDSSHFQTFVFLHAEEKIVWSMAYSWLHDIEVQELCTAVSNLRNTHHPFTKLQATFPWCALH